MPSVSSEREAGVERPCPSCGELNPPRFSACWNCEAELPSEPEAAAEPTHSAPARSAAPADGAENAGSAPAPSSARAKRELVLVLLTFPLTSIALALTTPLPEPRNAGAALAEIVSALGGAALLAHLLAPDGGAARRLGLARLPRLGDVLWGVGLAALMFVSATVAAALELSLDPQLEGVPSRFDLGRFHWLGPLNVLGWVVWEEVLFRAYLWLRLSEVTRRPVLALVLAAALFSVGHVYALPATVAIFFGGILLGTAYWERRSLWAPILAHWFFNLWVEYG